MIISIKMTIIFIIAIVELAVCLRFDRLSGLKSL